MKKENYYKHIRKLYMTPEIETIVIGDGLDTLCDASVTAPDFPWGDAKQTTAREQEFYDDWEDEEYEDAPQTYYNWNKFFPNLH